MSRKSILFVFINLLVILSLVACGQTPANDAAAAEEVLAADEAAAVDDAPTSEEALEAEETPAEEVPEADDAAAEEALEVEEAPAEVIDAALKITGSVASEQFWTEEEVKSMDTTTVKSTNNQGEASNYTGVLLASLLETAQPNPDATTVVFVAGNGKTAEITLEELIACVDCIVSFRNKGGFSTVLPGYPGNMQVKDVVEIRVK